MKMRGIGLFGIVILSFVWCLGSVQADLKLGFYAGTCPQAEKIVFDYVKEHIPNAPSLAAALIRMHFHDCFVRGCDGSVLINSTSNNQAEKDGPPNVTLRGFGFIERVKSLLEDKCPGLVSCADVLALVARDSIVVTGGPFWNVPTGRRDGVISNISETTDIPAPTSNLTTLQQRFAKKGLDLNDLVLLSGAHTIGVSHCSSFSARLYNFNGVAGAQDPSMDSEYVENLKARKCKISNDNITIVEMDPGSFRTFDLSYYTLLLKRRGLFVSDAALTTNSGTKAFITQLVEGPLSTFFDEFAKSMEKMGRIEVKTGSEGEIRKRCAVINS